MTTERNIRFFLIVPLALGVLAACGQKGPLVLPDRPAKPKAEPAAAATRPAEPTPPATSAAADESADPVH